MLSTRSVRPLVCLALLLLVVLTGAAVHAAESAPAPTVAPNPQLLPGVAHSPNESHVHRTPIVPLAWSIPFVILLGCIAVMPLASPHFWEKNYMYVALVLGAITALHYLFFYDHPDRTLQEARVAWLHGMEEYVSFIALLGSLFMVAGGIVIDIDRKPTPLTNTSILAAGAILANLVGTTGAAMLLIRPFLRINAKHIRPYHVVFFIFIVANVGGGLTPIGDPPLFMGYLKGVPFFWVLEHTLPEWMLATGLLLGIFFAIDATHARRLARTEAEAKRPTMKISGIHNVLFLGMILAGVFQTSIFETGFTVQAFYSREIIMVAAALLSRLSTRMEIYKANRFNYHPILEVAFLFAGIFSTMIPALNWLNNNANTLPLNSPTPYYFITGGLSSVLDNAPTYLVFLEAKRSKMLTEPGVADDLAKLENALNMTRAPDGLSDDLKKTYEWTRTRIRPTGSNFNWTADDVNIGYLTHNHEQVIYLVAISIAAVFFGACTYIGNGPNFMVKAIAESAGVAMPSFFGYVLRFALPILVPLYVLLWYLFFILRIFG